MHGERGGIEEYRNSAAEIRDDRFTGERRQGRETKLNEGISAPKMR